MVTFLNIKVGVILVHSEEMEDLDLPRQKIILLQLHLVMI